MCEVTKACKITGNFWVQSKVEAKNIIACSAHLALATRMMPIRPAGVGVGSASVEVRQRVEGIRWR